MKKLLLYKIWVVTFFVALVYYVVVSSFVKEFHQEHLKIHSFIGGYGFFSLAIFIIRERLIRKK